LWNININFILSQHKYLTNLSACPILEVMNYNILIISHLESNVGSLRRIIERGGSKALISSHLEEILKLSEEEKADLIIIDGDDPSLDGYGICQKLKGLGLTQPILILSSERGKENLLRWLKSGVDDFLSKGISQDELLARIDTNITRSQRILDANPTTKLPGNASINREIDKRIKKGMTFAVCYADLDNFKAYNDRYSYFNGDKIIILTAHILRDIVRDLSPEDNFIGHIGGDDFIFIIPPEKVDLVCGQIIKTFDTIIPYRYSEEDRKKGYIISTDRKHRAGVFPLMSISIGVVTNKMRTFFHPAHVSQIATEMKNYVKTMEGSRYAVDRRGDDEEFISRQKEAGFVRRKWRQKWVKKHIKKFS